MELRYTITVDHQLARLSRYAASAPHMAWMPRAAYVVVAMSWFSAALFYVKQGHER